MSNIDPKASNARRAVANRSREPASLVRRGFAMAIDLLVAALIGLGVQAAARASGSGPWVESTQLGHWMFERPQLVWSLTFALPAWLVLSACEALPGRAGPGKRVLRVCIEGPRAGESPSFARIALRTAIKLVPWHIAALALLFPKPWNPHDPLERSRLIILLGSNLWLGIYLASAAMTRRRQSLHDLATGTAVVEISAPLPSPPDCG